LPDDVTQRIVRLKGLSILVDHEKCINCRTCIESCFVGNITFCKGCGQCVASCPQKALTAEIDNVEDALAELNLRIKERITID
jgi:ferredoxin